MCPFRRLIGRAGQPSPPVFSVLASLLRLTESVVGVFFVAQKPSPYLVAVVTLFTVGLLS